MSFAKLTSDGQPTAIDLKHNVLQRSKAIAVCEGVKKIYFQLAYAYDLPFAEEPLTVHTAARLSVIWKTNERC